MATVPLEDVAELRDSRQIDGGLEDADRDRVVRQAVSALPPKYRDVLILFYFRDMDVTAAALSLGLPEGTVKARLFRGRLGTCRSKIRMGKWICRICVMRLLGLVRRSCRLS